MEEGSKSRYVAQARVWIAGGEMLARKENRVEIDPEVKDKWGIPVLKIHFTHGDNDYKLMADFQQKAQDKHPTLTMMALTARGCDRILKKV